MLFAEEYLGEVGVGATSPLFFRADDEYIYIVKLTSNPLGTKVLVSEQIAAYFGRILHLPFPASDIICITDTWLSKHHEYDDSYITAGYHFASRYLPNVRYATIDRLSAVSNRTELAGMILFDHLLHNGDRARNRKNMLVTTDSTAYPIIYGIDHSHIFHSGRWSIDSLDEWAYRIRSYTENLYGLLLEDHLYAQDFSSYVDTLLRLDDHTLKEILRSVPRAWLPDNEERKALYRFLCIRRDLTAHIYQKILSYIPRERGGLSAHLY